MDILSFRAVQTVARSVTARRAAQTLLLVAAGVIVIHGLTGPSIAPRNLATVVTSIHWRGLLVLGLLVAGNLFCAACPMMLVRDAARRFTTPRRRLPRWARGKWIGILLMVAALYSYELFGLWERPAATAWIVIAYFVLALVVDLAFEGASFCKHVCPVGQFNFIASTISPSEVRSRDASTCQSCRTADCINGRIEPGAHSRTLRGCELGLFIPSKVGNLDCTLCLDCVRACPHDNVAIVIRAPGAEWLSSTHHSGIGRLHERVDLAILAAVFSFAALLTSFVMTAPGHAVLAWLPLAIGTTSTAVTLMVLYAAGLLIVPALLIGAAMAAARVLSAAPRPDRAVGIDLAFSLVPLGFMIWAAHYGFHLLTGALTIVPVTQSAMVDWFGRALLGGPDWRWVGLRPGLVYPIQIGLVTLGTCGSLGLAWRLLVPDRQSSRTVLPGAILVAALAVAALWVFSQPMDMRGVGGAG